MYSDLWNFIHDHLLRNERVVLMVVLDVKGSSPGRAGFKMAVAGNHDICGSIGGGVMEYNMVELALRMISDNKTAPVIKRQIHLPDSENDKSGLICSGEQTQALIPLSSTDREIIKKINECLSTGEKGILKISPGEFSFMKDASLEGTVSAFCNNDAEWGYSEELGLKDNIYIFGAGHISLPLSQIMRMLDFRVIVYDDREGLTTFNANNFAHRKKVIDYNNIAGLIPEASGNYAAIMSFAHKSDKLILSQLLPVKLSYLGMIGSKSKVQKIFDTLREEGYNDDDLARVDSPIGISINSQTPAEIAVSIAAKIIQTKNSK